MKIIFHKIFTSFLSLVSISSGDLALEVVLLLAIVYTINRSCNISNRMIKNLRLNREQMNKIKDGAGFL